MARKRQQEDNEEHGKDFGSGLGGILRGFGELAERLSQLAEKGEELKKSGEIKGLGDKVRGIYGFSVKVGLGGDPVEVEPFGNIHKDKATGEAVVHEIREPMVDVFEEEHHVLVVAEMPGIGEKDIRVEVVDDVLTLTGEKGDKKYRKEVLLPRAVDISQMKVTCNNGVAELKFPN